MLDGFKFSLFHHQFPVASFPFPVSYRQECVTPLVISPGRPILVIYFSLLFNQDPSPASCWSLIKKLVDHWDFPNSLLYSVC